MLFLFSTQSFADLSGKAIFCRKEAINTAYGFLFLSNDTYQNKYVTLNNDEYRIVTLSPEKYRTTINIIFLTQQWEINRKTLKVTDGLGKDRGICKVVTPYLLDKNLETYRKEKQNKLNENLKKNKI